MTILKALRSVKYAWNGLKVAWKEEHNFRIEILAAILVLVVLIFFRFSYVESALCIVAIVLVLSAEVVNTAVEDMCNKIEMNQDLQIRKIKDLMALYVLVSVVGAFMLGALVFLHHFLLHFLK